MCWAEDDLDRSAFTSIRFEISVFGVYCKVYAGIRCEVSIELGIALHPVGKLELYAGGFVDGSDYLEFVIERWLQEAEIAAIDPSAAVLSDYFKLCLQIHGLVRNNSQLEGHPLSSNSGLSIVYCLHNALGKAIIHLA